MRALRGFLEAETPAARNGHSPLTSRETEILRLVASGLKNREIATSLGISEATAQVHVKNILAKLGFSSRSQVAAWLTEHRTLSEDTDTLLRVAGTKIPRMGDAEVP
jgi:DNA-binding NarL/FixJ family response regulator